MSTTLNEAFEAYYEIPVVVPDGTPESVRFTLISYLRSAAYYRALAGSTWGDQYLPFESAYNICRQDEGHAAGMIHALDLMGLVKLGDVSANVWVNREVARIADTAADVFAAYAAAVHTYED